MHIETRRPALKYPDKQIVQAKYERCRGSYESFRTKRSINDLREEHSASRLHCIKCIYRPPASSETVQANRRVTTSPYVTMQCYKTREGNNTGR
jgi:hypothetical protein